MICTPSFSDQHGGHGGKAVTAAPTIKEMALAPHYRYGEESSVEPLPRHSPKRSSQRRRLRDSSRTSGVGRRLMMKRVATRRGGSGLTQAEASSLLRDASRSKFEADTGETVSLNATCLVAALGGSTALDSAAISSAANSAHASANAARPSTRRGGSQQLLTFGFSRGVMLSFLGASREFSILATIRGIRRAEVPLLRRCRWRRLGIGVPFPFGMPGDAEGGGYSTREQQDTRAPRQLLAALSHAVPLAEAFGADSLGGSQFGRQAEQAQQQQQQQQTLGRAHQRAESFDEATFVPMLFKGHSGVVPARGLGRTDAFLSSVRALTSRSVEALSSDVDLLMTEHCVCFSRFEATGAPYNILATRGRSVQRWRAVRRRIVQKSEAVLAAAAAAPSALPPLSDRAIDTTVATAATPSMSSSVAPASARGGKLVLIASSSSSPSSPSTSTLRSPLALLNEAELIARFRAAGFNAERIAMSEDDAMAATGHAARISALNRADALVAIGSAWLAHAAFLPSGERPTALVEIYAPSGTTVPWTRMREWHDDRRAAKEAAKHSLPRSPHDPLRQLSNALMGPEGYARVAAWPLPTAANCTVAVSGVGRVSSCASRRIMVDLEVVVRHVTERL